MVTMSTLLILLYFRFDSYYLKWVWVSVVSNMLNKVHLKH